ncbi:MAG TPA: FkbM family methyltransferase [Chitinophagaceae bacterium]|nr:FkbM family methyltransferase [Chitinophagaceae bacterium]
MKLLYQIINAYTRRFPFPARGSSLLWPLLKRTGLYQSRFTKKIFNGLLMQVCPAEHIQRQILWHGIYEKEASHFARSLLRPGDVMIDIGANTGYYTLIAAAAVKQQGRVIAFEPVPRLRHLLEAQLVTNRLGNVTVESAALGEQKGQAAFFVAGDDNTGMSGLRPQENFSGVTLQADITPLDTWLATHPQPAIRLIKIDTEGAELQVLRGMRHTIEKYQPVLLLELMNELLALFNHHATEIYDLLQGTGYKAYTIKKRNRLAPAMYGQTAYNMVFAPAGFTFPPGITILPDK